MKVATLVCALALLTSCVPWTVVPIEDSDTLETVADPATYVDSIWESRLLPTARNDAADLSVAEARQAEGVTGPFLVNGTGRVLSLDTSSRSGVLLVDLEPFDGTADAAIQVGPVILGTALRDAAGFIQFTDFVNQLQYADVANELNRRVVEEVIGGLNLAALPGRTISFLGAWKPAGAAVPAIVPVEVAVE